MEAHLMATPVFKLQASGQFHVPGTRRLVAGRDVRRAVRVLPPTYRRALEAYLRSEDGRELPPAPALQALKEAVLAGLQNGRRATP